MRKLFAILVAVLLTATVWAQAPQKMSYQAVIRNAGGNLATSIQIGMEINIHQGSPTGTIVYTETQTPTTNSNGLISIEIGGGAGFSSINWGGDTYFIETKTAVVPPLTTYTIIGVSQLLSVPYALHAKTAETITGTITESDPIYTNSQAANITANDITKLSNLSGTNTGDQDLTGLATTTSVSTGLATKVDKETGKGLSTNDYTTAEQTKLAAIDGSETKVTAGTNITVTGAGTTASPYVVNATTHYIGESYGGGIVFWVDATGQHGLIAATADQSAGIQWNNGSSTTTNAVRDGIGAGMYNTERIIANQGAGNYAAQLCANYQGGGYGDWCLPSKYELNLLYAQKVSVGGFDGAYYCCSSENDHNNAWIQSFINGLQIGYNKDFSFCVRAVRAF
jgi:hypothetical protein